MILVVGATGQIGSEIVRLLRADGKKVRGLTRGKPLPDGVERAEGDLDGNLDHAFAGVERAFVMTHASPHMKAHVQNAVSSAKKAGTKHVVFLSSYTVEHLPKSAIGRWHKEGEDAVEASGVGFTFLRPGNFSSNALRWADTIRAQGSVFDASSGSKTAPIDPRDIAAVAARALVDDGHNGRRYVLTSATPMTVAQQIETLAHVIGKSIKHVPVPVAGARAGMVKSGMPEFMADAIVELIAGNSDDPFVTSHVKDVVKRDPHSFESWATENKSHFA